MMTTRGGERARGAKQLTRLVRPPVSRRFSQKKHTTSLLRDCDHDNRDDDM